MSHQSEIACSGVSVTLTETLRGYNRFLTHLGRQPCYREKEAARQHPLPPSYTDRPVVSRRPAGCVRGRGRIRSTAGPVKSRAAFGSCRRRQFPRTVYLLKGTAHPVLTRSPDFANDDRGRRLAFDYHSFQAHEPE